MLDRGDVAFDREPRRVLRARVLEALVMADRFLHVGRRLIDRRDDRAGRRIRLLPGVDADGGEARTLGKFHVAYFFPNIASSIATLCSIFVRVIATVWTGFVVTTRKGSLTPSTGR